MARQAVTSQAAPSPTLEIVATIGPASLSLVRDLCAAGATALRLNASHFAAQELETVAGECRASVPDVPIVVDLKGAKMRLGSFSPHEFREGDHLTFATSPVRHEIPLPHPEIFCAVAPGETLGCDDDRLHFRVSSVSADAIEAKALCSGSLLPYKGINVIEHPLHLNRLTCADVAAISATTAAAPVAYAFSFMEDGREASWVREHAPGCQVVGKVERREAAANLRAIADAVDVLWVCRGDLGAQLGLPAMARWIADLEPTRYGVPVLMAGQVLEHLTHHHEPTRAEVCHLFELWRRGYAGFVLSDETAIGKDPTRAVGTLRSLMNAF